MKENRAEIKTLVIPDDDLQGWRNILKEGGSPDSHINRILNRLNKNHFLQSKKEIDFESEIEKENEERIRNGAQPLSKEEKDRLKKHLKHIFNL